MNATKEVFQVVGYWLIRAYRWLVHGGVYDTPCGVRRCPYGTVGYSAWCRRHTDEILEQRLSDELTLELRARGFNV